jgi:hypothetical protein
MFHNRRAQDSQNQDNTMTIFVLVWCALSVICGGLIGAFIGEFSGDGE